jgi:hypothetical protein
VGACVGASARPQLLALCFCQCSGSLSLSPSATGEWVKGRM